MHVHTVTIKTVGAFLAQYTTEWRRVEVLMYILHVIVLTRKGSINVYLKVDGLSLSPTPKSQARLRLRVASAFVTQV